MTNSDSRTALSAHTPGPWEFREGDFMITAPNHSSDGKNCWHVALLRPQGRETDANARLIAAAPDLLAALQWILGNTWKSDKDNMEFTGTISCYQMDKIRAAIAKAVGDREGAPTPAAVT